MCIKEKKKSWAAFIWGRRDYESKGHTRAWKGEREARGEVERGSKAYELEERGGVKENGAESDNYYHRGSFPRSIFEILLNCLAEALPPPSSQYLIAPPLPPGELLSSLSFFSHSHTSLLSLMQFRKTASQSPWSPSAGMSQGYMADSCCI